jgi:hypothetical protein
VAEDWRLTITLDDEEIAGRHVLTLAESDIEQDLRERIGDRVAVSVDGPVVFVYADTGEALAAAREVVDAALKEDGAHATIEQARWHPVEQRWEPADVPLPMTDAERAAEHARLEADEAEESADRGFPEWEVRVTLPDHHGTQEFAERLRGEGIPVVARWHHLLIGAASDDEAKALADRVRAEAPEGTTVEVEPSGRMAFEVSPGNPFAIFGGLAL